MFRYHNFDIDQSFHIRDINYALTKTLLL